MADDEPDQDPDRAAILARRQRFIALALSGLAGAAACDACEPKPCLNVSQPDPKDDGGDAKTGGAKTGDPHACLSVAPPDPTAPPRACLDVDVSAPPQPCLHGGPPAKPQPCLEVMPDPKPEPKPQPCLSTRPRKPPREG